MSKANETKQEAGDGAAPKKSGKLSFKEKFSVGTGGLTVSLGN